MSTGTKKRVHVISRRNGWAVMKEGNSKVSKIYSTKDAAVQDAKKIAQGSDVVIHRKDGSVQKWETASA